MKFDRIAPICLVTAAIFGAVGCGGDSASENSGDKAAASHATPIGVAPVPAAAQTRTLTFPSNSAGAILKIRNIGQTRFEDWRDLAPASGQVSVPPRCEIMLAYASGSTPDLTPLASLRPDDLQELFLEKTNLTDSQIPHIQGLAELVGLDLNGTPVTDASLAYLSGLQKLKKLALGQTQITDAGLVNLAGMAGLEKLWLHETKVTDDGLKELAKIPNLKQLIVSRTGVTDAGLANLAGAKALEILVLENTAVTDAGLPKLSEVHSLHEVVLTGAQTTAEGRAAAEKLMASCKFTTK